MECDMTKGSPLKLLLSFSLPIFFGNLFQQLYAMVDTIVVGRFVGVDALAAVGSTSGFSFMVIGFAQGLTAGFSVLISQKYGAKDYKALRKTYAMSIFCSACCSLLIAIAFAFLSMPLLRLIHTPDNIIADANSYILIIYIGIGASVFYNLFSSVLRAVGDGRSPLYFLLISSVLNIALDIFFVIVFRMGCAGVAIATVIAQSISAVISYLYIKRRFPLFSISPSDFRIDRALCIKLLRIGLPGALQFSVCAIGVIIVQSSINTFGSDTVAAYSVGNKIENLIVQYFPAIGMAISTFAGQNLGAGRIDRIHRGFRTALVLMIASSIVTSIIGIMLARSFCYIFVSRETTSGEVISMAVQYMRIVSLFFIPLGSIFIFRTGCQGLGSGLIPMISSLLELGFRVISTLTLPGLFGYLGICFASPLAWVAAGGLLPICYILQIRRIEKRYGICKA